MFNRIKSVADRAPPRDAVDLHPQRLAMPPDVRQILARLRLQTLRAQPGVELGQHRSHQRGAGLEFSQYRAYEPGDELRRVDWKLYARSDRFFVRESERDSPLTLWLLVDASASMQQPEPRPPYAQVRNKFDVARGLAWVLCQLALQQRDRCGLIILDAQHQLLQIIQADSSSVQRSRLQKALAMAAPSPTVTEFTAAHAVPKPAEISAATQRSLGQLGQWIKPGSLLVSLSDGFDAVLIHSLLQLSAARRDVFLMQLLSSEERDFPFQGHTRLLDPESGESRNLDAGTIRKAYFDEFSAARQQLVAQLAYGGVKRVDVFTDQVWSRPLLKLFGQRMSAADMLPGGLPEGLPDGSPR